MTKDFSPQRALYLLVRDKYDDRADKATDKDRRRIKRGEPLDYIIGWKPFLNCRISLSIKPFIPRAETEFWVEKVIGEFRQAQDKKKKLRILDLFCGSGCIGVAVLKNVPGARVDFADNSARYLAQARKNITLNGISLRRVRFIRSNLFLRIRDKYDVILANPPYIAAGAKKRVQPSVLRYEPHGSLFGGIDGMWHIKSFIAGFRAHLRPGGTAWMEFGEGQKQKIAKELDKAELKGMFHKDQYGRWRYVKMVKS